MTRLPVGRWLDFEQGELRASTLYFPFAGALVGGFGALVFTVARDGFSNSMAVLLSMLAMVLLTGALHEDGLADAADGFGGGRTKERALEIMRDSRIGSYGAIALWFGLTLKFLGLLTVANTRVVPLWKVLVVAPMLARLSCMVLLKTCDYVRESSATSKPFTGGNGMARSWIAALYSIAGAVLLFQKQLGFVIYPVAAVVVTTLLCRAYFRRRIGGITGDCLGTSIVVSELAIYLVYAALAKPVV